MDQFIDIKNSYFIEQYILFLKGFAYSKNERKSKHAIDYYNQSLQSAKGKNNHLVKRTLKELVNINENN